MKKIKIVFFDCDGVLLFGNPWERLIKAVGLSRELDQKWLNEFYENKITFEEWMDNMRNFYVEAGLDKKTVDEAFAFDEARINKQAKKLIEYIKNNEMEMIIVSSGAENYVSEVAKYLEINKYFFNTVFVYDQNEKFVRIENFGDDPTAKADAIFKACEENKTYPTETIFIGDSINDYKAFELTKHGIMYGDHPKLAKFAWKKVSDLRDIIKILEDENSN